MEKQSSAVVRGLVMHFNLPDNPEWESDDGIAILATLCNRCAKSFDQSYYTLKDKLLRIAEKDSFHFNINYYDEESPYNGGIVYIETCYGQFSYHVFSMFHKYTSETSTWKQIRNQDNIRSIVLDFLADCGEVGVLNNKGCVLNFL